MGFSDVGQTDVTSATEPTTPRGGSTARHQRDARGINRCRRFDRVTSRNLDPEGVSLIDRSFQLSTWRAGMGWAVNRWNGWPPFTCGHDQTCLVTLPGRFRSSYPDTRHDVASFALLWCIREGQGRTSRVRFGNQFNAWYSVLVEWIEVWTSQLIHTSWPESFRTLGRVWDLSVSPPTSGFWQGGPVVLMGHRLEVVATTDQLSAAATQATARLPADWVALMTASAPLSRGSR
jgi:hypothetical protein